MKLSRFFSYKLAWSRRPLLHCNLLFLVLCAFPQQTLAHGHLVYPQSRAAEHIRGDVKSWPIAGIPARLRREPCVGLKPNKVFTRVEPGPLMLKLLFPDGANHKGYCTAYLYDPLKPEDKVKISETTNCGRSIKKGPGKKGQDVPGEMPVVIPDVVPCDPDHCVLLWEWTATHVSERNIERFEHYDNCADLTIVGAKRGSDFLLPPLQGNATSLGNELSINFFEQDWRLNPVRSSLHLQSVKNLSVFETHGFRHMEGEISPDGAARVVLDLASFDTGIDLRNVRMRFLFFKTFEFPVAVITAQLDKAKLDGLKTQTSITYPLEFSIELHGVRKTMTRDVVVTRVADSAVSVTATKPIIVPAEDFRLEEGVANLEDAAGVEISPVASITFELVFEGTDINPEINEIFVAKAMERLDEQVQEIDPTKCETRFAVISDSKSIFFKSGSSQLDEKSRFALDQIADFVYRCPGIRVQVAGHTDNVGAPNDNQRLSQQRAQSVMNYLVDEGISESRVVAVGFGDLYPEVPNDTADNRRKNRRIEFSLLGK